MIALLPKEFLVKVRLVAEGWTEYKDEKEKITFIYDDYRYTIEFRHGDVILHDKGTERLLLKLDLDTITVESVVSAFEKIHDAFWKTVTA